MKNVPNKNCISLSTTTTTTTIKHHLRFDPTTRALPHTVTTIQLTRLHWNLSPMMSPQALWCNIPNFQTMRGMSLSRAPHHPPLPQSWECKDEESNPTVRCSLSFVKTSIPIPSTSINNKTEYQCRGYHSSFLTPDCSAHKVQKHVTCLISCSWWWVEVNSREVILATRINPQAL